MLPIKISRLICIISNLIDYTPLSEQKESVIQALQQSEMFTLGKMLFVALTDVDSHGLLQSPDDKEILDVKAIRRAIVRGLKRSSLSKAQRKAYTELIMACSRNIQRGDLLALNFMLGYSK